ncbi:MAG TPA: hypothetical protein VL728_14085 [Cyclobacteriaceae bacterium]|jgi:hypothetical protein|nr:hypothetical protein [Cyclobacteriaceae bacterium]
MQYTKKIRIRRAIGLISIFCSACAYHDLTPSCSLEFKYDITSGQCKNCRGTIGYNTINLEEIRKSKNAECLFLSKLEVLLLLGDSVQIPQRYGYNKLTNYNFRGSVFDSCELFFNYVYSADLRGADLRTLQYGYAYVKGIRDNFTKAPAEGTVILSGDSLFCSR